MELFTRLGSTAADTALNVIPIVAVLLGFQFLVLRRRLPKPRRLAAGCLALVAGVSLFLVGLEDALFPIGRSMAERLVAGSLTDGGEAAGWSRFLSVYAFAAAIGFGSAFAEPALLAVALKAEQVSGGTVHAGGLRIAVALGAGFGVAVGALRIVTGAPFLHVILAGYTILGLQTLTAPRTIVPIAYDAGGVTTSTVTVPVVTALGLGLASAIPGRSPLLDGFGLIAFTCLFPIIAVLAYASLADRRQRRAKRTGTGG